MSKFGSLAANVGDTHKVTLIDPATDMPIKDGEGKEAFVEVLSSDSEIGRQFDKLRRRAQSQRAMRGAAITDDGLEEQQHKLAKLTKSWHLVDPATRDPLQIACNEENAKELYTDGGMQWLYRQVWLGANETANFIKRSASKSAGTPSTSSGLSESSTTAPASAST